MSVGGHNRRRENTQEPGTEHPKTPGSSLPARGPFSLQPTRTPAISSQLPRFPYVSCWTQSNRRALLRFLPPRQIAVVSSTRRCARGHVRVRVRVSVCGGRRACVLYRVLLQSVGYIAGCWEGYITKLTKLPSPPPLSRACLCLCLPPPPPGTTCSSPEPTPHSELFHGRRGKKEEKEKRRERETEREGKKEREREKERNTDRQTSEAADVMQGHVIRRGRLPRSRASRWARTG